MEDTSVVGRQATVIEEDTLLHCDFIASASLSLLASRLPVECIDQTDRFDRERGQTYIV